ncbi:hypothetical protein K9L97_01135 [Candidatus Woesearchaeota archaeon]|nr:hypothetical protein [Candidatus Woesearchaeota archaeon]
MKQIKRKDFTQEFIIKIVNPRKIGNQWTGYISTIHAANFFGKDLEVFPMRYRDEDENLGLAYYTEMPSDYYYRPYKVYKLKKNYKLANGETKTTWSYCIPIPAKMMVDVGISKHDPRKHLTITGGILEDGSRVILVQKYKLEAK